MTVERRASGVWCGPAGAQTWYCARQSSIEFIPDLVEWSKYLNAVRGHGFLLWMGIENQRNYMGAALAYVTGMVNQELLLQNELCSAEISSSRQSAVA
jgi:hypothetical protein